MEKGSTDIILLTKLLNKALTNDFNKRLEEFDLSSHQGRILFYINHKVNFEKGIVHQNDIEQQFQLSKSTVSGHVKRLEKKGLIVRIIKHPYVELCPTEKASSIVSHVLAHRQETINKLMNGFSEEEKEQTLLTFKRLLENMKED